jgi:hypothetical protein
MAHKPAIVDPLIDDYYSMNFMEWLLIRPLWKESLNSDSHQFHQYQQNDQEHTKNPGLGMVQAQTLGRLDQLMRSQSSPLLITGS